jgi:predicted cupin superfamily sugar epimerase
LSPATHTAADVISLLNLAPLPHEGGWFRRTHEAGLPRSASSATADARRSWSMIHALFTPEGFSALHRVAADELWIFQAGDPLELWRLPEATEDAARTDVLGPDVSSGQLFQAVVPARVWQGARLVAGGRWALVACVVVPEFRWEEFELGRRDALLARYPRWSDEIRRFTRA